MPEYIEKSAALLSIEHEDPSYRYAIERIPAADVVEVVRCKDCEYYEIGKNYTPYCNNVLNMFEEMKPDDFCSYGERRTTE